MVALAVAATVVALAAVAQVAAATAVALVVAAAVQVVVVTAVAVAATKLIKILSDVQSGYVKESFGALFFL